MNRLKESNVFSGGVIPLNNRRTLLKSYIWNYVVSNSGKATLENSIKGDIDLELIGGTEQLTTIGKNLANPSEFVIGTLAGNTGNIINLKQYITTGYIPVIPGKRYSTSCGNKFLAHTIIAYDKEKTKINSPINMSSEMPEGAAYIRQAYRKIDMTNVTESDMEELKKVCMVNEGSTVLPYEPYTGGKHSPSPEYQQEIKNSGKWNEGTQKYEIDVKITNAEQNWTEEQTLTLTSDRPITKWDKLVEQDGQIGWLYKHKIIEDFSALVKDSEPIYGKDGEKYFSVSLQNASLNYDRSKIYSEVGLSGKDNKIHYVPKPMIQSVIIYVSDTDTIMTAKEHMHYKVIYETIESQFVPISESEQTQLRNLHSYNGTTNITVDSGEVPCGIKVAYKQNK